MNTSLMSRQLVSVLLLLILSILPFPSSADMGEDGSYAYPQDSVDIRLMETKIGDSLLARLDSLDLVPVIITLKSQPMYAISHQVQARYWDDLRANEEEIRAINRKYSSDRRPANAVEAAAMVREQMESITAQDRQRIRQINERSKALKDRMRKDIMADAEQAVAGDHAAISNLVHSLNGIVIYNFQILSSVAARVPGTAIEEISTHPLVAHITEDDADELHLNISTPTTGAGTFWAAGETGGIWWNATCDTGVDTSHPALNGQTWWQGVFHAAGRWESNYNDTHTSTDDFQGHGTHVAGIANSRDTTYRGVSYGSTRSTNLKAGYRTTTGGGSMVRSDAMAAVHWGLNNATIDAINLSFGSYIEADDHEYARFWDAVVDAQSTIATISAGNDGPGDKTLGRPGIFYNGLCVAWISDMGTLNRNDDVVATNSSRGPTWNGRKKPDIGAPGNQIMAPAHNWEGTNPDFVNKSGTSMAAPHVSGGAILLHDVGISNPRVIKAILINTADFIQGSTGWNKDYGWGYMNLETAYLRRTNWFLHSVTPQTTPHAGSTQYRLYKVPNAQVGDKTTMVWNRRVNYNDASYPTTWYSLNDLNLRYYRESNNASIASSLSGIDNVEQVVSSTNGDLVIRAYAWSTGFSHPTPATETFALAVPPGTTTANGPVLSANAASSYTPPLNAKFLVRVRVNNTSGDLAAHNCVLTITLPSGVSLVSGTLVNNVGTVDAGSSSNYIDLWLRATTTGTKTVNMSVVSNSYGIDDWSGSGSFTINPGPQDTVAPYTVMPIGGPSYQTGGTDKIANGGFESDLAGWVTSGAATIETGSAYSGSKNLRLGSGTGSAYQSISIGSAVSRATLTFWYKVSASLFAGAGCQIRSSGGDILVVPYSILWGGTVGSWTKFTADVTRFKGQNIQVYFYSSSGMYGNSTLWVDEVSVKEAETIWVSDTSSLSLVARDDNSGIDYSQYNIAGTGWNTYSAPFTLAGRPDGFNSLSYRSVDNGGNFESSNSTGLYLDTEAPKSILRVLGTKTFSGGTERVTNGGFESNLTGWTTSGAVAVVTSPVYAGSKAAKVGETGAGVIYQDVFVQSTASRAILSFQLRSIAGPSGSQATLRVKDPATGLSMNAIGWNYTSSDWMEYVYDVTRFKGSSIRVEFEIIGSGGTTTTLYVDGVTLRQNANLYVRPTTSLDIRSAERSGVQKYESKIDSGSYVEGQSFTVPTPGLRTVSYRALDNLNHQESDVVTQVNVDNTGPTGSIVINGGATHTASLNVTLSMSATDPAGVNEMRVRSDAGVWGSWQAYQTSLSYTLSTTGSGTKTVGVEYRDALGNTSSIYTDDIQYAAPVSVNIPGAKMLPNNSGVSLAGKIVTAIFPAQGYFYMSEPDRTAGVRVRSSTLPSSLDVPANVIGVTRVVFAEREIVADSVTWGRQQPPIKPLAMNNHALGGAAFHYQPAVPLNASGVSTIGQLVTSWGRVTKVLGSHYYIDDGTNVLDSYPQVGVLVLGGDAGLIPPAEGQYVDVTGISGAETLGGGAVNIRVLRPRNAGDVKVRQFNAAFVYGTQLTQAQQFKSLLDGQGVSTDLVKYVDIETTNWSKYHTILIWADTGTWAEPAKVTKVLSVGTPLVGIGEGGARLFDAIAVPNLFIGWGQSAIGSRDNGLVFGGDIYTYPHNLGVLPGSNLTLFTTTTSTTMLYDPNGVSQRMIQLPGNPDYFPLASEAGRFYQWGYSGTPQTMTQTGRNLFTNMVFSTVRP
jgi:serine protease AprX